MYNHCICLCESKHRTLWRQSYLGFLMVEAFANCQDLHKAKQANCRIIQGVKTRLGSNFYDTLHDVSR